MLSPYMVLYIIYNTSSRKVYNRNPIKVRSLEFNWLMVLKEENHFKDLAVYAINIILSSHNIIKYYYLCIPRYSVYLNCRSFDYAIRSMYTPCFIASPIPLNKYTPTGLISLLIFYCYLKTSVEINNSEL